MMCRPKHLDCVNTPEGIRRINEEQSYYDKDPEEYERREEEIQQALWDEECQRRDWERMVYEENQDL